MRYNLSLLSIALGLSCYAGVIPAFDQSMIVNSGLPVRAGLQLWLCPWSGYWTNSGTIPSSIDGTVYQWDDLSGHTNHATQSSASLRPSLTTDWRVLFPFQVSRVLTSPTIVNNRSYTFLALARQQSQFDGAGSLIAVNGHGLIDTYGQDLRQSMFVGSIIRSTNIPGSDSFVFGMTGSATATYIYCENPFLWASGLSVGMVTNVQIGTLYGGGGPFNGKYTQALIYDRVLSTQEIASVTTWLHGFEPYRPTYARKILCVGDSLTAGYLTTNVLTYPYQLQQMENSTSRVCNAGYHGFTAPVVSSYGTVYDLGYAAGLTNYFIEWVGINDISSSVSATTIYSNIVVCATARSATGWKPVILTVTPSSGLDATQESNRVALNALILGDTTNFFTKVDVASDSRLTNSANTTYYADGRHMTAGGYWVVASLVQAALSAF